MSDQSFPNMIDGRNFHAKCDATAEYNCVAWALHSQRHYIWPDKLEQFSWPIGMRRDDSPKGLLRLFEYVGFAVCAGGAREIGFEKIAIYAKGGWSQHVARQLPNGKWTSKLGPAIDVEHSDPSVLTGPNYGEVVLHMRRKSDGRPPTLPKLHPPPSKLIDAGGMPLTRK